MSLAKACLGVRVPAGIGIGWRGARGRNTAEQFIKIHGFWKVKRRAGKN